MRERLRRSVVARAWRAAAAAGALALAACAPTARPRPAAGPPAAVAGLTDAGLVPWLDSVRQHHGVPAMAAIVVRADTVLARGAAGVRRAGDAVPVTIADRFQLGSNTKALTAVLLARLVEAGTLGWTSTPADVFPELRDSISAGFRGATLERLLSHHAGVSPYTDTDDPDFRALPRLSGPPPARRRAFAAHVLRGAPVGSPRPDGVYPGLYSNGDYVIAAAMAERATGESWEALMEERVFRPLGLRGTFAWSDAPDLDQPWGHHETRGGVRAVDPRDRGERVPPILWPAGAVELSIDDYGRYLQLHLRGLAGRDTPLLRATTIARLHASPAGDRFALGWGVQEFVGAPASAHVGSAGAFYAVTVLLPTRDLAVAVFANAGGDRAATAARDALRALARRHSAGTAPGGP